jgi:hypothetical protein
MKSTERPVQETLPRDQIPKVEKLSCQEHSLILGGQASGQAMVGPTPQLLLPTDFIGPAMLAGAMAAPPPVAITSVIASAIAQAVTNPGTNTYSIPDKYQQIQPGLHPYDPFPY